VGILKAHTLSVAYLKAFATARRNKETRFWHAWAVDRAKCFRASLKRLCAEGGYYTADSGIDAALFMQQENAFGDLLPRLTAGDTAALLEIAEHLWLLKLRNTAILDSTRHRLLLLREGRAIPLGERVSALINASDLPVPLVTSDDPVLLFGDGLPSVQCFVLPISPDRILVSAPKSDFRMVSSYASTADVELLNRLQCRQARRYVIMRDEPIDPTAYQAAMSPTPRPAASGAALTNGRGSIIINVVSTNPSGPDSLPSFLQGQA